MKDAHSEFNFLHTTLSVSVPMPWAFGGRLLRLRGADDMWTCCSSGCLALRRLQGRSGGPTGEFVGALHRLYWLLLTFCRRLEREGAPEESSTCEFAVLAVAWPYEGCKAGAGVRIGDTSARKRSRRRCGCAALRLLGLTKVARYGNNSTSFRDSHK